jgi:hypothetical protein
MVSPLSAAVVPGTCGFAASTRLRVNKPENDDPSIIDPIQLTTDAA